MEKESKTMEAIVTIMQKCLPHYHRRPRLVRTAKVQDRLGWDYMLEGRIPKIFVEYQRAFLAHTTIKMTAKRRTGGLVAKLLQMIHKRWLLRNAKIHITDKENMNAEVRDKLLAKIERLV